MILGLFAKLITYFFYDLYRYSLQKTSVTHSKCFRGGDPGHQKAIELAVNAMGICYKSLERARARQPESDRSPTISPDFLRRISKITGLTGTALLVYIILSEGSRLFPPRNLIPVP